MKFQLSNVTVYTAKNHENVYIYIYHRTNFFWLKLALIKTFFEMLMKKNVKRKTVVFVTLQGFV